jgi:hypothetical protein
MSTVLTNAKNFISRHKVALTALASVAATVLTTKYFERNEFSDVSDVVEE